LCVDILVGMFGRSHPSFDMGESTSVSVGEVRSGIGKALRSSAALSIRSQAWSFSTGWSNNVPFCRVVQTALSTLSHSILKLMP